MDQTLSPPRQSSTLLNSYYPGIPSRNEEQKIPIDEWFKNPPKIQPEARRAAPTWAYKLNENKELEFLNPFDKKAYPATRGLFAKYFKGIELYFRTAIWIIKHGKDLPPENKNLMVWSTNRISPVMLLNTWFLHVSHINWSNAKIQKLVEDNEGRIDVLINDKYKEYVDHNALPVPLWFDQSPYSGDIFDFVKYSREHNLLRRYFSGVELWLRTAILIDYFYGSNFSVEEQELLWKNLNTRDVLYNINLMKEISNVFSVTNLLMAWYNHENQGKVAGAKFWAKKLIVKYKNCEDVLFNDLYRQSVDPKWVTVTLWFTRFNEKGERVCQML